MGFIRGPGSCPMCRPMHLKRPIAADRQISECKLVLNRRLCRFLFLAVLVALLLQVQSKDISSMNRTFQELVNNNRTKNNSSFLTNEIAMDSENDNDNFQLGYSGYLRSSTSMLTPRHNITNSILAASNNGTSDRSAEASSGHRRFKRGVSHLYNMIVCATGCNPLAYKGYGCYCGFLGSGYPMDGIDRCCKMHDWCYDATECPMFVEYFVPYYWKCYRGYKPICAIEHGEWGSSGSCAQRLCECDRSFAECLRRYRCPRHKAVCTSSPWRLIQNIFMII